MSEAGGGRSFSATPVPGPLPFSQMTPNWPLQLPIDFEERARGRRSRSTLLLKESILEAWEEDEGGDAVRDGYGGGLKGAEHVSGGRGRKEG